MEYHRASCDHNMAFAWCGRLEIEQPVFSFSLQGYYCLLWHWIMSGHTTGNKMNGNCNFSCQKTYRSNMFFPSGSTPKASLGLQINFLLLLFYISSLYKAGHHQTSPTLYLNYKVKLKCNNQFFKKFVQIKNKFFMPNGFVRAT